MLITLVDKPDDKGIPDNLILLFILVISYSCCENFIILLIKVNFTLMGIWQWGIRLLYGFNFFLQILSLHCCFFAALLHTGQ